MRLLRRDLRGDARSDARLVDTIALDDARYALLERSDDQNRLVDETVVSGLEEQRYDVDDRLPRFGSVFALHRAAPNVRMEQGVETFARRRIVEHDLGERRPVERAVAHDLRPDVRDPQQSVAVRRHDLTRDGVGVDHEGAEFGEERRNLTLSRPDAAGQTNAHGADL